MNISIETLNKLLKNREKYKISKKDTHRGIPENGEGNQGEYNEYCVYYKHPDMPENIFLQEVYQTNSYGYGNSLTSLEFVQGKEKTIKVYEPI